MAHCYLTGVQFPLDEGFVLNRREARHLARALQDRVNALQQLIEQLAGWDDTVPQPWPGRGHHHRRHRMVCQAVAEALASAYPEKVLFRRWPEYLTTARLIRLLCLRDHPLYGNGIKRLTDDKLLEVITLSKRVQQLLDPNQSLPQRGQLALRAGICVRNLGMSAEEVVGHIRTAIFENRGLEELGMPASEREYLVPYLDVGGHPNFPSPSSEEKQHDPNWF